MNTLPRTITSQILIDPDVYTRFRVHWREMMTSSRKHELHAAHHLVYAILLGRDWRKGFTCPTNHRKLENGAFYGWMLFRALAVLHRPSREAELLAPFDGIVMPAMLQPIRQLVPYQNVYSYRAEQFTIDGFPFEAYSLPATV